MMTAAGHQPRRRAWKYGLPVVALLAAAAPVVIQAVSSAPPAAATVQAGTTTLVSPRIGASTPAFTTQTPAYSPDGRYVALVSPDAIDPADTNSQQDVYLYDTTNGHFTLVSRTVLNSTPSTIGPNASNGGTSGNGIAVPSERGVDWDPPAIWSNGDLTFVAFASTNTLADVNCDGVIDANDALLTGGKRNIWLAELTNGQLTSMTLVTQPIDGAANGDSSSPSVGFDGNQPVVAFASTATNLVNNIPSGTRSYIYRWRSYGKECARGTYSLASRIASVDDAGQPIYVVPNGDSKSPSISQDGQELTFASSADNLVDNPVVLGGDGLVFPTDGVTLPNADRNGSTDDVFMMFPTDAGRLAGPVNPVDFTNVKLSVPSTASVQFTNRSLVPVRPSSASLTGSPSFAVDPTHDWCTGRVVPAGGFCTLDITFTTASTGVSTASLTLSMTGSAVAPDPVDISGNGDPAGGVLGSSTPDPGTFDPGADVFTGATTASGYSDLSLVSRTYRCNNLDTSHFPATCRGYVNEQATGRSIEPAISAAGRFADIAFTSYGTFTPVDDNGVTDVYGAGLLTNGAPRTNTAFSAVPALLSSIIQSGPTLVAGDGASFAPVIAATSGSTPVGRWVAFASEATNLVASPPSTGALQVVLHDRDADGNNVLDTGGVGATSNVILSQWAGAAGTGDSGTPSIIARPASLVAGDVVGAAIGSDATNLDPPDGNGPATDVLFEGDVLPNPRLQRVSSAKSGLTAAQPSISADGHYVAFASASDDLVPGDTNGRIDVFVRNTVSGTTTRVSLDSEGAQLEGYDSFEPSISADGRYVAYTSGTSAGSADRRVWLVDTTTLLRTLVSQGWSDVAGVGLVPSAPNGPSSQPAISADGNWVAYTSAATNLMRNDFPTFTNVNQVYVFGRTRPSTDTTSIASQHWNGEGLDLGNGASVEPTISATGNFVAFSSDATNLIGFGNDTNEQRDVFRADMSSLGSIVRISVDATGAQVSVASNQPSISDDGQSVAFRSGNDLAPPRRGHVNIRGSFKAVQWAGETLTSTFTVRNDGTAAFTIQSIGFTTPASGLTVLPSSTCAAGLVMDPLGATCTVVIQVTGVTVGSFSNNVVVQTTQAGLSGQEAFFVDVKNPIAISAPVLDPVTVNTLSATQSVVLTNVSSAPGVSVSLSNLVFTGATSQYQISGQQCAVVLAPGASCTAALLVFAPTAVGFQTINAPVTGSVGGQAISGLGTATVSIESVPQLSLRNGYEGGASLLSFGDVYVTNSATRAVVVYNGGPGAVTLGSPAVSGSSDFTVDPLATTCGATLAEFTTCEVSIDFTPSTSGWRLASMTFPSASTGPAGTETINLSGRGIVVEFSPTVVDFGTQLTNTTQYGSVNVQNYGPLDATIISTPVVTGPDAAAFLLPPPTGCDPGTALPANSDIFCNMEPGFSPTSPRSYSAYIEFDTQQSTTSVVQHVQIPLVGRGGTGLDAYFDPSGFPDTVVNTASSSTVTLFVSTTVGGNFLQPPLVLGGDTADFSLTAPSTGVWPACGTIIPTTGYCALNDVTFAPTSVGSKQLTVTINAQDDGGSTYSTTAAVTGTGIAAPPVPRPTTQVYVRTLAASPTTVLVSQSTSGLAGNGASGHPSISGSGRRVAFDSTADNLDPADTTTDYDVFIRDLVSFTTDLAGVGNNGQKGVTGNFTGDTSCRPSGGTGCPPSTDATPSLDRLGNRMAFVSDADNFDAADVTGTTFDVWVRAWAPNLVPMPLAFGTVSLPNQSPAQTSTLTNTGFGIAELVDTTTTGPNIGDFPQQPIASGACVGGPSRTSLGLNDTCIVTTASFKPTAGGARSANVNLRYTDTGLNPLDPVAPVLATTVNAPGAPPAISSPVVTPLTGTGFVPISPTASIVIAPAIATFVGTVGQPTSPPTTFTVTNNGNVDVTLTTPTKGGANPGDFVVTGGTCAAGLVLTSGANCTIIVTFTAGATGSRTATLTQGTNTPGASATANLSGRGVTPQLVVQPNPANFGSVNINTNSSPITLQVRNTGSATVTITGRTFGGANVGEFTPAAPAAPVCVGSALAPGATCNLAVVTFKPTAPGTRTATVQVTTNITTITASGTLTGVGKGAAGITIIPTPADFGVVPVGATSTSQTLTVTNTGQVPFSVVSRSIGGADPADFTVAEPASNKCLGGPQLAPGQSCALSVHTFKPLAVGQRSASVVVGTSIGGLVGNGTLLGTGTAPAIVVEPNPMDFGDVILPGSSNRITAVVRNTGGVQVTITGFTIAGDNPGDFNVNDPGAGRCVGAVLLPNTTCLLGSFGFTPTVVGLRRATVNVTTATPGLGASATLVGAGLPGTPPPGPQINPVVQITPKVAALGDVVVIKGTDFPKSSPVVLRWDRGIRLDRGIITNPDGTFATAVLILPRDQIGLRQILALWGGPQPATDSLMVVLPTAKPRAANPALLDKHDLFRS